MGSEELCLLRHIFDGQHLVQPITGTIFFKPCFSSDEEGEEEGEGEEESDLKLSFLPWSL